MDKISPIKERILQFIEYKGIQKKEFCDKTGISYANMKGKSLFSEIGGNQIGEILSSYSEISAKWLLTGTGDMLTKEKYDTTPIISIVDDPNDEVKKTECKLCTQKDKTIELLIKQIDDLKNDKKILENDREWLKHQLECLNETKTKRHSA